MYRHRHTHSPSLTPAVGPSSQSESAFALASPLIDADSSANNHSLVQFFSISQLGAFVSECMHTFLFACLIEQNERLESERRQVRGENRT